MDNDIHKLQTKFNFKITPVTTLQHEKKFHAMK